MDSQQLHIDYEDQFADWFNKNYKLFNFTKIIKRNLNSFPDYIMELRGRDIVSVELELTGQSFLDHNHKYCDIVICASPYKIEKLENKGIITYSCEEWIDYFPPEIQCSKNIYSSFYSDDKWNFSNKRQELITEEDKENINMLYIKLCKEGNSPWYLDKPKMIRMIYKYIKDNNIKINECEIDNKIDRFFKNYKPNKWKLFKKITLDYINSVLSNINVTMSGYSNIYDIGKSALSICLKACLDCNIIICLILKCISIKEKNGIPISLWDNEEARSKLRRIHAEKTIKRQIKRREQKLIEITNKSTKKHPKKYGAEEWRKKYNEEKKLRLQT